MKTNHKTHNLIALKFKNGSYFISDKFFEGLIETLEPEYSYGKLLAVDFLATTEKSMKKPNSQYKNVKKWTKDINELSEILMLERKKKLKKV